MAIIIIMYLIISSLFLTSHYKKYSITPSFVFVAMQLLMFIGIVSSGYYTNYVQKLSLMYLFALLFFIFGVAYVNIMSRIKNKKTNIGRYSTLNKELKYKDLPLTHYQMLVGTFLIVLSIAASAWYFSQAGINIFIKSIQDLVTKNSGVYTSERKDFIDISGGGYVYQFRTIILPILNLYLIAGQKNKTYKKLGMFLLPLTIVFLLGTGQRNAFVFVMLLSVLYLFLLEKGFDIKINKIMTVLIVSVAILFLLILTITNGRVSADSNNVIMGALSSLIDRIVGINSKSALNAFTYIETQPTVWGKDWFMMLKDILPGKSGYVSVASITYRMIYGTYRGTEPPCIWGSAWYNWSFFGVTIFPFILGIIYQSIYVRYKQVSKTKLHVLFYAAFCVFLGLWFCDGPMVMFNNGVVTVLIMKILFFYKPIKA